MSWAAKLLIAGAILSISGPSADEAYDIEHFQAEPLRRFDRLAQLRKDPETDPGGLPGRMDERPRTRGVAPSAPRSIRPNEQDAEKSKSAPATPQTDSAKPDKSEKRQ